MPITINGVTLAGNSVSIINGKVIIDGVEQKDAIPGIKNCPEIIVHGNVNSIDCVSCTINGDVLGNIDATSVTCHDVHGSIDAVSVYKK